MGIKSTKKFTVAISVLAAVILFFLNPAQASTASDKRVEFGIEALKQGDYDTARQWLLSAQQQGATHPDLTLALGLSAYYAGELEAAATYLKTAAAGAHRYEAAYYLGEITRRQGALSKAQSWYEIAASQYEDIEIQKVADNALLRLRLLNLTNETLIENVDAFDRYVLVSLETAYTAGLTNPEDSSDADAEDTSTTLLAAGGVSLPFAGSDLKWLTGASYYAEKYADFSAYDVSALSLHTGLSRQFSVNKLLARVGYTQFELAGDPYLNQSELRLENKSRLSNALKLVVTGKLIDIDSPTTDYAHSAGTLYDLSADIRRAATLKWRLGVSVRRENRGSRSSDITIPATGTLATTYTSYAKDWIKVSGKLSWSLSHQWRQTVEAAWRASQYHDTDRYLASSDDVQLTEQQRQVQRLSIKTELSRQLTKHLDGRLSYQYLTDDANIDTYDFTSHTVTAGIAAIF